MLRAVLTILVAAILVASASITLLVNFPGVLKPVASMMASRITGYELSISGNLRTTFSLQPTFIAEGVSLTNAKWAQEPHLANVEYVRVQVDLPGLFEKRIELLELFVRNGRGAIEITADRVSNLDFLRSAEDEPSDDSWEFLIQGLAVDNVSIITHFGELPPILLEITEVIEVTDPDQHLEFTGYGELNANPWRLTGKIGPLSAILSLENVLVDLDLELDEIEIFADGEVGKLTSLHSLALSYSMHGDDASVWGELLGTPQLFQGDVSLTGTIEPAGEGLAFSTRGNLADYDVDLAGTVRDALNLEGIDLSFLFDGPDISILGLLLLQDDIPSSPFSLSGQWELADRRLIVRNLNLETNFLSLQCDLDLNDFPELDSGRASIRFAGADAKALGGILNLPHLISVPFTGSTVLDAADGRTEIEITLGRNRLLATGVLGALPDLAGTRLKITASGEDLTDIAASFGSQVGFPSAYVTESRLVIEPSLLTLREGQFEIGSLDGSYDFSLPLNDRPLTLDVDIESKSLETAGASLGLENLPDWPAMGRLVLSRANEDFRLESARLSIGVFELAGSGTLGNLSGLDQLDLAFEVSGPSTNIFMPESIQEEEDYPFTISGRFSSNGSILNFDELKYLAEETVIDGVASVPAGSTIAGMTAQFSGHGPSLRTLYPGNSTFRPADARYRIEGGVHLPEADVIQFRHIKLAVNELSMDANGTLDLSDHIATDLDVSIQGPSLTDIGLINERVPPDVPFQLTTSLHGEATGLEIEELNLVWADSDVRGNGSIHLQEVPRFIFRGQSDHLDLLTLEEALMEFKEDEEEDERTKMFPDDQIPLERLLSLNADVDVVIREFSTQLLSFDEVSTSLTLEDGAIEVDQFEFRDAIGHFSGTGSMRPSGDQFVVSASLAGDDADLGLFTSPDQPADSVPRYTLDVDLQGRGGSVAEIMGTLDGTMMIHSDGGQIDNDLIDLLGGDFLANVLGSLFPFEEPLPYTRMECLVFKGRASDGVLSLKPGFTARTPKVNAFVLGNVDLRNETLALSFSTQARSGLGISASSVLNPYFMIGGSMAEPELEFDTASAAVAYSLAAGTGGLSILIQGFMDRIRGERNPCDEYLKLDY